MHEQSKTVTAVSSNLCQMGELPCWASQFLFSSNSKKDIGVNPKFGNASKECYYAENKTKGG
jgi:hypothetical protein